MNEWYNAMATELRSIKNDVWKLVDRSDNKNIIKSRIMLTNKYQSDGCLQKRKARIVARGFSHRPGIDFDETFASVARLSSIRLVMAIAAHYKMHIYQCDITTAYLNSVIKEEVYMEISDFLEEALEKLISLESHKSSIKLKAIEMLKQLRVRRYYLLRLQPHRVLTHLYRWKANIEKDGTNADKVAFITKYVLQKFEEARERRSIVHDMNSRALEIDLPEFKASKYWIWKFKNVHGIVSRKITTFRTPFMLENINNKQDIAKSFVSNVRSNIPTIRVENADESSFSTLKYILDEH
ncbi:uncharacterized protein LOC105833689 isoform X2 [Monomorium pharaonis]|uniref:uncharacterized protein LOC105833689 isoform X2 n=1 Tax=Monomorium pharaonis TaxID=307658 RepID=UPI0017478440|nr:uncharacterized protein LOC105833689 isoform X2 [Monomorium pharaonis]